MTHTLRLRYSSDVASVEQTEGQEDSALVQAVSSSRAAHLRLMSGDGSSSSVTGNITIGREAATGVPTLVVEDPLISRSHARIEWSQRGWSLLDLGSRNGAFVNGRVCGSGNRMSLPDGAVIRIGDTVMLFRSSELPLDDGQTFDTTFPGHSPQAVATRRRIARLASTSGHVLVLGETGTGKERVARSLAIPGGHIVVQNCAELTHELMRSELFGHVRGAFSGAVTSNPGVIERATNGTLFLDEIGELPTPVQADLLRFLEDGSYRPVGSAELKRSNARVIAATNVEIDQAVKEGRFRRDLAARLRASNTPLELAPLRDRAEDIPLWANMFLREGGDVPVPWTAGALEMLLLYPWPENLRELRGIVRTLLNERTAPYATEHFPTKLREHRALLRNSAGTPAAPVETERPEPSKSEVESMLQETRGKMRTTAQLLGIDRRKLYRLCERYGIDLSQHRTSED